MKVYGRDLTTMTINADCADQLVDVELEVLTFARKTIQDYYSAGLLGCSQYLAMKHSLIWC